VYYIERERERESSTSSTVERIGERANKSTVERIGERANKGKAGPAPFLFWPALPLLLLISCLVIPALYLLPPSTSPLPPL
jgi:hypothetical protein